MRGDWSFANTLAALGVRLCHARNCGKSFSSKYKPTDIALANDLTCIQGWSIWIDINQSIYSAFPAACTVLENKFNFCMHDSYVWLMVLTLISILHPTKLFCCRMLESIGVNVDYMLLTYYMALSYTSQLIQLGINSLQLL